MLIKLWHKLFHPPKHKHIHTYIDNSMQIDYEDFGGFVTGQYITTCPICKLSDTITHTFLFDNTEEIIKQQKFANKHQLQQPFTVTLEEAKDKCINYKGK